MPAKPKTSSAAIQRAAVAKSKAKSRAGRKR